MRPFFCYYGGKWRAGPHYPVPMFNRIIEPFAGAAGYSVRYFDRQVELYDIDERIYGIWSYLIKVHPAEIMSIPINITHVDELKVCQEAKWLIGYWFNKACAHPMKQPSTWMKSDKWPDSWWGEVIRKRLAYQVSLIKHWKVYNKDYRLIDNREASWFIDPPYLNKAGRYYKYNCNGIDYSALGSWCRDRVGQVVVCENDGAEWLPFVPFRDFKSAGRRNDGIKISKEVIWTSVN
jgi:site-specific DNA-adenine methylase